MRPATTRPRTCPRHRARRLVDLPVNHCTASTASGRQVRVADQGPCQRSRRSRRAAITSKRPARRPSRRPVRAAFVLPCTAVHGERRHLLSRFLDPILSSRLLDRDRTLVGPRRPRRRDVATMMSPKNSQSRAPSSQCTAAEADYLPTLTVAISLLIGSTYTSLRDAHGHQA